MVGAGAFQKKGAQAEKGEQVWRMVTSWSKKLTPIFQNGAERFAENIAIMSGGRLKIKVYAGGELVKPLEVFDAVSSGTVECGHAASYYWDKKVPAAQWFTTVRKPTARPQNYFKSSYVRSRDPGFHRV